MEQRYGGGKEAERGKDSTRCSSHSSFHRTPDHHATETSGPWCDPEMQTLAGRVRVLWLQWTNLHRIQKSRGEKGMTWLLSKRQRVRGPEAPTPAWTGFDCFSVYITLRMVLVYFVQVPRRWWPFIDNKGKNVANYFKGEVTDHGGGGERLNWLHSILRRFSLDFRKLR